ncbi:MAG: tetratricopeptide repeat protein, partial [Acidobacteriota bacterium]
MVKASGISLVLGVLLGLALGAEAAAGADKAQQYLDQGIALAGQNRHAAAIAAFTQAIEANPKMAEAYRMRAISRKKVGDARTAIKDYDKAIELDPGNGKAYNGRALAKIDLGDLDGALADASKAVEINPRHATAHVTLAQINLEHGNTTGALAACNQAIQADPKESTAWWQRAKVRSQMDDDRGALADYSEVIKLSPRDAGAYNNRGAVKQRLGDLPGARQDFAKAVEIDPGNQAAKENLTRVQAIADERKAGSPKAAAGRPKPGALPDVRASLPPIDPASWLPRSLTGEAPDDPCNTAKVFGDDVPWQSGGGGAATSPGSAGEGGITPFDEIAPLASSRSDGAVSVAIEGMRLLYGPMSREQDAAFNKKWLPLRDFPTLEVVEYCNRLNPLLGQLLSLRGAIAAAAADFDNAWAEAVGAAGADDEAGTREALGIAQQGQRLLVSLAQQATAVSQQIAALGNPPDPWAAKCEARTRHKKASDAVAEVLGGAGEGYSAFEGEWEGTVSPPWSKALDFGSVEPIYMVIWQMSVPSFDRWSTSRVLPKTNRPGEMHTILVYCAPTLYPGLWCQWFHPRADLQGTRPGVLVGGGSQCPELMDVREEWSLVGDTLRMPSPLPDFGTRPGAIATLHRTDAAHFTEPGFRPADVKDCKERVDGCLWQDLEAFIRNRAGIHRALASRPPQPPPDVGLPDTADPDQHNVTRWLEGLTVAGVAAASRSTPAAGPAKTAASGGSRGGGATAGGAEEQQARQDRIAFHTSNIAMITENLARDEAELAKETDPERRGALEFRLLQARSNIQNEQDQVASISTGDLVYSRTPFDDYARERFIDKTAEDSRDLQAISKAIAAGDRLAAMLPSGEAEQARAFLRRQLGPDAIARLDVEQARKAVAAIHEKVAGYLEGEAARSEEAAATAKLFEDVANNCATTGAVAAVVVAGSGSLLMGAGSA